MKHEFLDTVGLARDIPSLGLLAGDLCAIVEVYGPDAFEVEFVTASCRTGAMVTLQAEDIRSMENNTGPSLFGKSATRVRRHDRE